jgi:hypothetical protein
LLHIVIAVQFSVLSQFKHPLHPHFLSDWEQLLLLDSTGMLLPLILLLLHFLVSNWTDTLLVNMGGTSRKPKAVARE